jgi:hypothetical protein
MALITQITKAKSTFEHGEGIAGIRTLQETVTMKNCMLEAFKEHVENCEILKRNYKYMMMILKKNLTVPY